MANDNMQFTPETRDNSWTLNDPMHSAPSSQDTYGNDGEERYFGSRLDSTAGSGSSNMQQQNSSFSPEESPQAVGNPQNNEEVYLGSFQAVLQNNLGYYVVIDFLIGTSELTSRSGILYAVGNNFVTLYEPESNRYIVCDLFSVKFVTFYPGDYIPNDRSRNRTNGYSGRSGMNTSPSSRRVY